MRFVNEALSPGLKRGGVLNIVRHDVEVICPYDHIPPFFEVDLTGLEIGRSIHISAVQLPKDAELTIKDRDFTIATIAGAVKQEEEAPVAAAAAACRRRGGCRRRRRKAGAARQGWRRRQGRRGSRCGQGRARSGRQGCGSGCQEEVIRQAGAASSRARLLLRAGARP